MEVELRVHPAVRFIPLGNAPPSPVSLAFRPGVREPLLRRFVQAALTAVELSADNTSERH